MSNDKQNSMQGMKPEAHQEELEGYKAEIEQLRKELENARVKLMEQEKMASLGQMTAGIAHEIKNPLNFVNNFSKLSKELIDDISQDLSSEETIKDHLEDIKADLNDLKENIARIEEHGGRADSIVSNMLMQSRGERCEKMKTDINKLLDEYTDLAFHGMKAQDRSFSADIEKDFDDQIAPINVVPQDISRVFINIITNAFQALREHYRKSQSEGSPKLNVSTSHNNSGVHVTIGDNGPGIPDDIRNKILEPFFTTKPSGEGTGLGLSMSNDIVKEHGGTLDIHTEVGSGTEFRIYLPYEN